MKVFRCSVILFAIFVLLPGAASLKAGWISNGNPICTAMGDQHCPRMVSDGHGEAIIVWTDYRNGNCDIYAQRVDAYGNVQWTTDGVAICTRPDYQSYPSIVTDCSAGAVIVWIDEDNLNYYTQRIDLHGQPRWEVDGIYICGTVWPLPCYPSIVSDGSGGLIIAWTSYGDKYGSDISAARLDSLGAVQWGSNVCKYFDTQFNTAIVLDGAGGAIVAWADNHHSGDNLPIYAQRIDAAGNGLWIEDGIPLHARSYAYDSHAMIPDGAGGAIITWADTSNSINAQKVDSSGALQWSTGGVNTGAGAGRQMYLDESGGLLLVWSNDYIIAARINEYGGNAWERNICDADGIQNSPHLVPD